MLDRRAVAPSNFVECDSKDRRDLLPLGGAGCPATERDGEHAPFLQVCLLGELGHGEGVLLAEVGDAARHGNSPYGRVHLTHSGQIFRRGTIVRPIVCTYTLY